MPAILSVFLKELEIQTRYGFTYLSADLEILLYFCKPRPLKTPHYDVIHLLSGDSDIRRVHTAPPVMSRKVQGCCTCVKAASVSHTVRGLCLLHLCAIFVAMAAFFFENKKSCSRGPIIETVLCQFILKEMANEEYLRTKPAKPMM